MRLMKLTCAVWMAAGAVSCATVTTTPHSTPDVVEWRVSGLEKAATIRVDRWGVPHVEASTHYDAFFVQGFNAARDRLWQIDIWRRRGLGRLSEVLGEAYVDQDRAARLFLYRGSMFREWLAYGSDAKRVTEAFVAGINAWIALTRQKPDLLAPEFGLLRYEPELWRPEDVVRIRSHGLWRNLTSEVRRSSLMCGLAPEVVPLFMPLEPEWTVQQPEGFDPCNLPKGEALLKDYRLAKAAVAFGPAIARMKASAGDVSLDSDGPTLAEGTEAFESVGSNNWAISPSRTATGRPILADDPHRGHAVPSLRYIVHLKAPGLNVIGAGEPALPGISIGHNERIGFGLTIFSIDQEDLYIYETHPEPPLRYRYGDDWEAVTVVRETIKVRDGEDRQVELAFTRHGPVLYAQADASRLYAARVAWLEPGMAPYFGSVEYMRANNWREFVAALNRWGAPAENQVYADVDGHIGYKPAGLAPRRENWDGLLPVPGDGRYEWNDFISMDALPETFNPSKGWVATANQMSLPDDYPVKETKLGFEWASPWRYQRIEEVLSKPGPHSVNDSVALQRDYGARLGLALVDAIAALGADGLSEEGRRAYALLRAGADETVLRLGPDEPAAALYNVWFYRHLRPAIGRRFAPNLLSPPTPDSRGIVRLFRTPSAFGGTPVEILKLVDDTLAAAYKDTSARLGADSAQWRWGALHRARFAHPLLPLADPNLKAEMTYTSRPRGGDAFTPNNTAMRAGSFNVVAGASFRMVLDVGEWDQARMTNAPAQSGVPGDANYRDLLDVWAGEDGREGSVPLLYSDDAIRAHTRLEIRLMPDASARAKSAREDGRP